uniref:YTH domain-containing family protein n=1 Tax=Salix viminalis TaxID=40686 RepID=A0A6N2NIW7_SALVM
MQSSLLLNHSVRMMSIRASNIVCGQARLMGIRSWMLLINRPKRILVVVALYFCYSHGQFVGLAEMMGHVDFNKTVEYWQQDKWTGCFPLKWHIIKDVPNGCLRHITLENNENKPVTNSRDTQEVMFEKGVQILKIFKDHKEKTSILDDFGFRREACCKDGK